ELFSYEHDRIPVSFHGTGDRYASVVTGALMRGLDLPAALTLACDHTAETIRATLSDQDHHD
ncbi:MAG: bifunctional hydroxymethylpyrimidine kinase/phosphomethylpyrimidine kinase, partial [Clostridia bacterium]|nr:bifunctional hydroxymethylpyrimidine kinase/phosphomethylpyrimidine kinase [Clostridia bacterium]